MPFCECGALIVTKTECKNCARPKSLESALGQPEKIERPDAEALQAQIADLIFKMYNATKVIPFHTKTYQTVVSRTRAVTVAVSDSLPAPSLNKPQAMREYALDANRIVSERGVSFPSWAGSLCYLIRTDRNFGYRINMLAPEERGQLEEAVGGLYNYTRSSRGMPSGLIRALWYAAKRVERYVARPQNGVIDGVGGNKPKEVCASEARRWDKIQKPFRPKQY